MMANESDILTCSDSKLTKKLLQEDPEQFYTLVRMHLSFVLDLNTDDCDNPVEKTKFKPLKWNFLSKKVKGTLKGVVEKVSLTEEGLAQIAQLIEFLSKIENISQEGIFRLTGALSRQNKLKSLISQSLPLNLDDGQFSVHDCASVLKSFLSELPEPLLSEMYFPAYVQISELCALGDSAKNRLLRSLQLLLLLLPSQNLSLLKDIIRLLHLTASHEDKNKMSPENLATLFTPHLLCPRKLTPEALHANSQKLSRVVVFMIQAGLDLFDVPPTLATDIRAYWADKSRKQIPVTVGADIIKETRAVNTVFSFVDRARTAQENTLNPTEEALAQLYAHIQSMPESSKKRRLVKQFNKENGQGTPRQFPGGKCSQKSKGLGDSIKKQILKKNNKSAVKNESDSREDKSSNEFSPNKYLSPESDGQNMKSPLKEIDPKNRQNLEPLKNLELNPGANKKSEDASTWKLSNNLQTSSRTSLNNPNNGSQLSNPTEKSVTVVQSLQFTDTVQSLQFTDTVRGPFFSPRVQLRRKSSIRALGACTPIRMSAPPKACSSHLSINKFNNFTSTPACKTPSPLINDDMSPITLSAQKMTKAMQETMMTPRSRKPVIAISDSNLSNLTDIPWSPSQSSSEGKKPETKADKSSQGSQISNSSNNSERVDSAKKDDTMSDSNDFHDSNLLADTFCDYLYSRSILTASPVDLSFSSRTGDFEHSSSNTLSMSESLNHDDDDPQDNDKSVIFSDEERISRSLLYFLDGNEPPFDDSNTDSSSSRKRSASDSGLFSPTDCLKKSPRDLHTNNRSTNKVPLSETSL